MKPDTINSLKKTFDNRVNAIYLAGPFFNKIQVEWANILAHELRGRGYLVHAPVDYIYTAIEDPKKSKINAKRIFARNILWLRSTTIVLAQLDYPLEPNKEFGIATTIPTQTEFNGIAYQFETVKLPDAGTIWEVGYAYAKNIPVIGYTYQSTAVINLMITQALTGFCTEPPLDIFLSDNILWNLIQEWGRK